MFVGGPVARAPPWVPGVPGTTKTGVGRLPDGCGLWEGVSHPPTAHRGYRIKSGKSNWALSIGPHPNPLPRGEGEKGGVPDRSRGRRLGVGEDGWVYGDDGWASGKDELGGTPLRGVIPIVIHLIPAFQHLGIARSTSDSSVIRRTGAADTPRKLVVSPGWRRQGMPSSADELDPDFGHDLVGRGCEDDPLHWSFLGIIGDCMGPWGDEAGAMAAGWELCMSRVPASAPHHGYRSRIGVRDDVVSPVRRRGPWVPDRIRQDDEGVDRLLVGRGWWKGVPCPAPIGRPQETPLHRVLARNGCSLVANAWALHPKVPDRDPGRRKGPWVPGFPGKTKWGPWAPGFPGESRGVRGYRPASKCGETKEGEAGRRWRGCGMTVGVAWVQVDDRGGSGKGVADPSASLRMTDWLGSALYRDVGGVCLRA